MIDTAELMRRRDEVNDMFILYSDKSRLKSNIEALSQLALIGGRLDVMIRRRMQATRRMDRRQVGQLLGQIADVEGSKS